MNQAAVAIRSTPFILGSLNGYFILKDPMQIIFK